LKRETALALRAVDRRFYTERAEEFSATRERPWKGWTELLERVQALLPAEPRVLDVGCGNGRFARFLEGALGGPFRYTGVDASPLALDEARRRLAGLPGAALLERDLLTSEPPLPPGPFDLVALFGVLHHVPGRENREKLLRALGDELAPRGLLAFTTWRFDRYERFRDKLVPLEQTGLAVDPADLEPGDYFMTWGAAPPALRYCHAVSDGELDALLATVGLTVVERFEARDEPNTYVVLGPGGTPSESR